MCSQYCLYCRPHLFQPFSCFKDLIKHVISVFHNSIILLNHVKIENGLIQILDATFIPEKLIIILIIINGNNNKCYHIAGYKQTQN